MTSRDFAYWLQGFFEISGESELTTEQVDMIKKHLNMVFYHEIDPSFKEDSGTLQDIHSGVTRTYDYRGIIKPGNLDSGNIRINC